MAKRSDHLDVLFMEGPERKTIPSKMSTVVKVVSKGIAHKIRTIGEKVFTGHDNSVCAETTAPPKNPRTVYDIIKAFPVVKEFVTYRRAQKGKEGGERMRQRMKEVMEHEIASMVPVYTSIDEIQHDLDGKRKNLEKRMCKVMKDKTRDLNWRSACFVYLDCCMELNKLYDGFVDEVRMDCLHVLTYANAIHVENSDMEISIDTAALLVRLREFQTIRPGARLLTMQIKVLQDRLESIPVHAHTVSIGKQLEAIFAECQSNMDEKKQYFPDYGIEEGKFRTVIERMPQDFVRRMYMRIDCCMGKPSDTENMVNEQCFDFERVTHMEETTRQYTFLLFARLFSGDIYVKKFSGIANPEVEEFQRRVHSLRKLSSQAIGLGEKFLPSHLRTLRFMDFPKLHPYSEAVETLAQLTFHICPLDLCKTANAVLRMIQNEAKSISFAEHSARTGLVLAESDHVLSLDDLCDVTLIILLISDPIGTLDIIRASEPFHSGMQMPSEWRFAFMTLRMVCEYIMALDMVSFIRVAKERLEMEQDMDPLQIGQK